MPEWEEFHEGRWLSFYDANGKGYAQPDFYARVANSIIIIEAKLKQHDEADVQLLNLYGPLLAKLHNAKLVWLIQCFKFPRREPDARRVRGIEEALGRSPGVVWDWHWLG